MNRPTAKMRDLARWLVAHEHNQSNQSLGTKAPLLFGAVVGRLRRPMIVLAGAPVFRSLIARALVLALDEVPALRAAHVNAEGVLAGSGAVTQLGQKQMAKAEAVLIAHLLAMLFAFIGEALTLRLLQDVWPDAPLKIFNSRGNHSGQKTS